MVTTDSRQTECSNLTEARWTQYICNHENIVLSRLLPQQLCGNSCTWEHEVRLHIAGTSEYIYIYIYIMYIYIYNVYIYIYIYIYIYKHSKSPITCAAVRLGQVRPQFLLNSM